MASVALTPEEELTVRKELAAGFADVTEAGYIIPTPNPYGGRNDFWAQNDHSKNTKDLIETSRVAALWFWPSLFTNDFEYHEDAPRLTLNYELYLFREYAQIREDESEMPDAVLARMLREFNTFYAAVLKLREKYLTERNLAILSDFAERQTQAIEITEPVNTGVICQFVPGTVGWAARMRLPVTLLGEC